MNSVEVVVFGTVVEVEGSRRDGKVLVVCEHASRRLPDTLGDPGLSPDHPESHIDWDIGAAGLAQKLSLKLNGPLMLDAISRLAERVLRFAQEAALPHRDIRFNALYGPEDGVSHTLDRHAAGNDLPSVMIEIRKDLIADKAQHASFAADLAGRVRTAGTSLKAGAAL